MSAGVTRYKRLALTPAGGVPEQAAAATKHVWSFGQSSRSRVELVMRLCSSSNRQQASVLRCGPRSKTAGNPDSVLLPQS